MKVEVYFLSTSKNWNIIGTYETIFGINYFRSQCGLLDTVDFGNWKDRGFDKN